MTNANLRLWTITAAGTALYFACAWFLGAPQANARQESKSCEVPSLTSDTARVGKDGKKPTPIYYGEAACNSKGCHGGDPPQVWVQGRDLITRGNEAQTFSMHDKHNDAFKALEGARGKRMAKILGYDVTKAKECLTCHSSYVEDKKLLKESLEAHFDVRQGVSCVACHGAYEDWVANHSVLVAARHFRELTSEAKEAQYGMANLRNPVRQSELCNSCHIGNLEQGKFVTHEMYAAGHPPLSSFEVANWSQQMPKHWEELSDKSSSLQKELGLRKGELTKTQLVVMGVLVSFRDSLRLIIGQACEAQKAKDPQKKALDLSNFDCWACHHELKKPSHLQLGYEARAKKGEKFVAGRVPWRSWSAELVPTALDHIALVDTGADVKKKQFEQGMQKLKDAFSARAYGNPALIEKAGRELVAWCDGVIPMAQKAYATRESSSGLLAAMAKGFEVPPRDFDSARMVGWGFGSVFDAVHGDKGDMNVRLALKQLNDKLKLTLPAGRKNAIENELTQSLKAINSYDSKEFSNLWSKLRMAFTTK